MVIDRVLNEVAVLARQAGKGGAQTRARVVVARYGVERHGERGEEVDEAFVLGRRSLLDEIAGEQEDVRRLRQSLDVRHGALEVPCGAIAPIDAVAGRRNVQVGDLADDHGRGSASGARG